MKIKHKIGAALAALFTIASVGLVAAPAQAGDGFGRIGVTWSSVTSVQSYTDYLCRNWPNNVRPGQQIGGWGNDQDAIWVPGGRVTTVQNNAGGVHRFDRRGLGGFCHKVNDFGAWITVAYR